jgi:hypothetical protein
MASVAICPHCYLQLAIPDHAERDAEVECPSCHTEFGLDKATVRAIPQGVLKERSSPAATDYRAPSALPTVEFPTFDSARETVGPADEATRDVVPLSLRKLTVAGPPAEQAEHADSDIAAWFRSNKTVADMAPVIAETAHSADENDSRVIDDLEDEDDAVPNSSDPTTLEENVALPDVAQDDLVPARPSAVTLANWQALRPDAITRGTGRPVAVTTESTESADAEVPGPSFDLPDVPLTLATGATVEFGSDEFKDVAASADFELDDVEFDSSDNRWMKDEFNSAGDAHEPAHDPNARTMADVGLLDGRLRESSYEESLRGSAEEPAAEHYEHSTSAVGQNHGDDLRNLPSSLPPQRGGRRKRSALRTMVSAVAAAPVGLALGYFALLWIKGPSGDFLQMAKYIPPKLLPASFMSVPLREESAVAAQPEPMAETAAEPVTKDSANIPASYVTPVKPASEQPSDDDNRYGAQSPTARTGAKLSDQESQATKIDEPRRFTDPNAASLSGEDPHIIGAPLFTVAEFAAALAKAQKAESGLITGDLSDPSVRREKGMSYAKLCDLAQMVTFCDDSSAVDHLNELRHDANELFQTALAAPHTRDEVAQIASIWIGSPHRQHGGVFLAGSIHGGEVVGDAYEYQLSTEAGGELKLLLPRPLDTHVAADGHPVGIVGSIVDNPAGKVSGYTGTSPRVIWVHDVIPLN